MQAAPAESTLPAFGEAPFGNPGPLLLEQASIDGRWLSVCQARVDSDGDGRIAVSAGTRGELRGDALGRYLISPAGEEQTTDGVLAADPQGRFVLLLRGAALVLWDSRGRSSLDLSAQGADARLSAESFAALRTADFDAAGANVLYVRAGESGASIVVRRLSDGSERSFDPGPGLIWRARFDRGGAFLVVELLRFDSNRHRKADFPAPLLSAPRPCRAGPGVFQTWVGHRDHPDTVLVPLTGGAPIYEPNLVFAVGDALLLRDATGALVLQRAGTRRVLEPAACQARVIHADAARRLFVLGCIKKNTGRMSLELVTESERKPLGIELARVEADREPSDSPRLVAFYPGADSRLFDAEKRELLPLQAGDSVVAVRGARALVRRASALVIYDADTHLEQALAGVLDKYPQIFASAPYAFVSPLLIDLDAAAVVGQSKEHVLALSNAGQLLLSDTETDAAGLTQGPLHWQTPGS